MFDLLKKKIGSFIQSFSKKEEEKPPQQASIPEPKQEALSIEAPKPISIQTSAPGPIPNAEPSKQIQIPGAEKEEIPQPSQPKAKFHEIQEIKPEFHQAPGVVQEKPTVPEAQALKSAQIQPSLEAPKPVPPAQVSKPAAQSVQPRAQQEIPIQAISKPEAPKPALSPILPPKPAQAIPAPQPIQQASPPKPVFEEKKEREFAPSLGILSKLKSVFTNKVAITEAETKELFGEFEIALLESDVSYGVAQAMVASLKKRLIGREVEKGKVALEVKNEIASAIQEILSQGNYDLYAKINESKAKGEPFKILFVGPNGAGKTTTISKIAFQLKQNGVSSVISASDTFRAAAIEQASFHGEKLGIKVVKHAYGADPAAVAFDAIKHAQANKLDCVLIDTAGRQETNKNLVEEMKKISRVCTPDAKLFVGEAIAGHALVGQVKSFKEAIGLDGIVLTKVDCDAKGGNSISLAFETKLPIVFIGIGQEYGDLIPFEPLFVARKVIEE